MTRSDPVPARHPASLIWFRLWQRVDPRLTAGLSLRPLSLRFVGDFFVGLGTLFFKPVRGRDRRDRSPEGVGRRTDHRTHDVLEGDDRPEFARRWEG